MALIKCKECGYEFSDSLPICPDCGAVGGERFNEGSPQKDANKAPSVPVDTSACRILGLIGSGVLFVGVFMPIVSLPVLGKLNYFNNGKGVGVILIIMAVASLILIAVKQHRLLWVTGLGSLALLVYTYIVLQKFIKEVTESVGQELSGNPFAELVTVAFQSVQLQWGWAIMVVGAVLLLAAAFVYESNI